MTKGTLVPEFPSPTIVLAGFRVTLEMSTGFIVSQEKLMVQLLLLSAILQKGDAGVSVPDMAPGMSWQVSPSQMLPVEQEAVAVASSRVVGVPLILCLRKKSVVPSKPYPMVTGT